MSPENLVFKEYVVWRPLPIGKPRNGCAVLLSNLEDPYPVFAMWNDEKGFWCRCDEPWVEVKFSPTHWAHLPLGVYNLY